MALRLPATSFTAAPRGLLARSAAALARRSYSTPSRVAFAESSSSGGGSRATTKQGFLDSLLRGSEKAQAEGATTQSHSASVARGRYIHEIQRHDVKPDCIEEYKRVLAEWYPKISGEAQNKARLTGSWEVTLGDVETFYHIWEYNGYAGYDASQESMKQSKVRDQLHAAIRPLIKHRSNWICQEFAFWPTAEPQSKGGVYELRTYHLKPGKLLEWEQHWRRGLEARQKYTEPVGAWFSQIGALHTVFHIWHYPSLEERKKTRDAAWQVETWPKTVTETVKLIDKMHAQIMEPLPFSPLK